MDVWLAAGAGLIAGGMLVVGAFLAWRWNVPQRTVASVMALGSGVLISALAFDLVLEAEQEGGFWPTFAGFSAGAVLYVAGNIILDWRDARNRRGAENPGTGLGIALGALLDGVPESAVLGLSMVGGQGVSVPVLLAIMISNLPEGLASTAALKQSGRSARYVFGLWVGIALACGVASVAGFIVLQDAPAPVTAFVTATAAGAILAMICDTMIPEAFRNAHVFTGLLATAGFLLSFGLHQLV